MRGRLLDLQPFRGTDAAGRSVRAEVERHDGRLVLRYALHAEAPDAWRLAPQANAPVRRDRLWEHTCLEAFVAPEDAAAYWEINLAPSGDWNVYRFDGPRTGMREESRARRPGMERAAADGSCTLVATLDLTTLPELAATSLRVGLAAVVEAADGSLAYWAIRHPGPRPDFHDRAAFVVRLPAVSEARA